MSLATAPEKYRRRRILPALSVVVVLLVAAGVIWFQALKPDPSQSRECNAPGPAPTPTSDTARSTALADGATASPTTSPTSTTPVVTSLGSFVGTDTLAGVRPAPPATVALRVFNASQVRGQAKAVTDEFRAAGFESIGAGVNDPLYPAGDLRCLGEIRFGAAGVAAARTVLELAPCAQLVQDGRVDDSVDFAIGARFVYAPISDEVQARLREFASAATPPAVIEGQTASATPLPPIPGLPQASCAT
ncbi:envelope integrity protein Cei [Nakamurella leprariae]|uniref:Envelope integrity protein Cei n=1 Tax=Nakamurella leprariae TaxID=2803911 RepID=A0A938YCK2_9ACTN|nr:envelope integrity protein Cei [Nakamurella leprariae]MBM9467106.1 envelope integrity protein Cei [Nakamurella leprariae]